MTSERLSDEQYWESIYRSQDPAKGVTVTAAASGRSGYFRPYSEFFLWDVILEQYFSALKDASIVELGSAPGDFLVRIKNRFHLDPYGAEYTASGAELNKNIFEANGIDPGQVIRADFLSADFQDRFRERFDAVISRGLLEHFNDLENVVEKHLNLLKPKGLIVISIPNFLGFNGFLQRIFNAEILKIHNLKIMEPAEFSKLFAKNTRLKTLFCGHYGVFDLNIFYAPKHTLPYFLLVLIRSLQLVLNPVFRLLFGKKGNESRAFSPYLIYIGRKL